MKQEIIAFINSNEEELELNTDTLAVELLGEILEDLDYELGEEQISDDVLYIQFFAFDSDDELCIKKPINLSKYTLIKG